MLLTLYGNEVGFSGLRTLATGPTLEGAAALGKFPLSLSAPMVPIILQTLFYYWTLVQCICYNLKVYLYEYSKLVLLFYLVKKWRKQLPPDPPVAQVLGQSR